MFLFDAVLVKFLAVGVVNTAVGSGLMFVLYNVFHVPYWASSACNYIAGGICSFFLNKYVTFRNTQKSAAQIARFILNLLACYFVSYAAAEKAADALFYTAGERFRTNSALCMGMALYTVLNYAGQRFFVFRPAENGGAA